MADTAITVTTLTGNAATKDVTDTAIVAANTHTVTLPSGAGPEDIILRLTNTFAGAKSFTILKGVGTQARNAAQGDLTQSLAQNEVWWVRAGGARFLQKANTLVVTVAAGTTGTIGAFYLPHNI